MIVVNPTLVGTLGRQMIWSNKIEEKKEKVIIIYGEFVHLAKLIDYHRKTYIYNGKHTVGTLSKKR